MNINPKSGLKETHHDFYNMPLVHQKGINALKFNGQAQAVHTTPLGNGLTLDFYARLNASDELIVTFPGAATRERNIYPLFSRVSTFRKSKHAFMAFADPTILMDKNREMRLSWFLGGPDFDPAHAIIKAIRKAQGKTGAKHIVFVGGSGGGLPALRLASMIPGSLAYLHEGTTNIGQSIPVSVAKYFNVAWPGWDQEKLLHALPERFDMVRHYRSAQPNNFVYFAQSEDDTRFRGTQYNPFREALGVKSESGQTGDGRRKFVLYKGEEKGHGKVTAAEFDFHFNNALNHWRERR
ncbi:hypothetical protein [Glutamicibacter arilaitensis]|uniref:hypothetical protein n=1 Tax=Glutamicibacter arilaitensis TaxID=256701 RepID=UPI003A8CF453